MDYNNQNYNNQGRPAPYQGDAYGGRHTGGQAGGWQPYGNGWQNPSTHQYVYTPAASANMAAKPPRKKGGVLGAIALVLAGGLAGFGGGAAATVVFGQNSAAAPEQVVITRTAEASGAANTEQRSVADIASLAGESVVAITTENMMMDFTYGNRVVSGAGSGVIISPNGTIITNSHVVDGATNITVSLPDGSEYEATVLGADKIGDIAVLKIEADGLTPAVLGDSDGLQVGDFVLAIGNPTGTLQGSVTDGIISALDRIINIGGVNMNLLQMSAAVSPGNSGGGLFNASGELIGVVTAKSSGQNAEGLGFAVPVNDAMALAEQLIATGKVVRPAIGVTVATVTSDIEAAELGVKAYGVYITQVNAGGPAAIAGVQAYDRVVQADGQTITNHGELSAYIASKQVGDSMMLTVERDGAQMEYELILAEGQ